VVAERNTKSVVWERNKMAKYLLFALAAAIVGFLIVYVASRNIEYIIPWALSGALFVMWRVEASKNGHSTKQKQKRKSKIKRLV
jgi:hypothetical protein